MADISRYKGGAARNRKPRGSKQVVGPTQQGRTDAREEESRQVMPGRFVPEREQNENPVRLNLSTGERQEEFPIQFEERPRRQIRPRANVGGNEVELDGDQVRLTRRFKRGGKV